MLDFFKKNKIIVIIITTIILLLGFGLYKTEIAVSYSIISGISSAVIVGIITFYAAVHTLQEQFKHESEKYEKEQKEIEQSILRSIKIEIETFWEAYMRDIGKQLKNLKKNQISIFYGEIAQDRLTIYHANASLIGKIKNDKLIESIIIVYMNATSLIDSINFNYELFIKYQDMQEKVKINHDKIVKQFYIDAAKNIKNQLKDYTKGLKRIHKAFKKAKEEFVEEFKKYNITI